MILQMVVGWGMVQAVLDAVGADTEGHTKRLSVLIVEDDPALRELLVDYLRREGYPTEEAQDGGQAVAALQRQDGASRRFGVVLLDLMLPEVSGLEVLEHLTACGAGVPVVVMSVNNALLTAAVGAGVQAVLIKPFDLEQLLAVVARYCEPPLA